MNKKVFTVKDENGNELELAIKKPTAKIRIDSQLFYNKMFKQAIEEGSMLSRNVEKEAEKLGLWSDDLKKEAENIVDQLRSLELKLRGGANSFDTKEEAKECALKMKELRNELIEINRSKDDLYPFTAESFADDARIKYFVSQCCIDNNTGKTYFKNYEDFITNSDGEIAKEAVSNYLELIYSDLNDFQSNFYENNFLKDHGFMDDKYRLVNKDGKLVDSEGNLIDENGRYILADGSFCDKKGNPVDADGNYVVEWKDFI
jgi:hypothetical protein